MALERIAVETVSAVATDTTLAGNAYSGTTETSDQYLIYCASGDVFVYAKNASAVETTLRLTIERDSFGKTGTVTLGTLAASAEGFFGPIDPSKHANANGDATLDATAASTFSGTFAAFRTQYGTL